MAREGFRPTDVSAYDTPDGPRFTAVAVKDSKRKWSEHHGMVGEKYQKEFDKLGADGFRPVAICGYNDGGDIRYAAVWYLFK